MILLPLAGFIENYLIEKGYLKIKCQLESDNVIFYKNFKKWW